MLESRPLGTLSVYRLTLSPERLVFRRWLGVALVAATVVAGLLLRMRGPAATSRQHLVLRLIPEEAEGVFDARQVAERVSVFSWSFLDAKDLTAWRVSGLDPGPAFTGDGLRVGLRSRDARVPSLVRTLDLDAGLIDAVEVAVAGPRRDFRHRGTLQIFWSGPGQEFDGRRSARLQAVNDIGDYVTTYSFFLRPHPLWTGKIARLRLDPVSEPGESVELRSVRGVEYRIDAALLEAARGRPWKVSLAGDLRGSLLAPPGRPLERQFVVPPSSSFRFAYGVPPGVDVPVRFKVQVRAPGHLPVEGFNGVVRPGRPGEADAWHEGSVDLSAFAGQRVGLALETTAKGPVDAIRGLPAFANPEVWSATSARLPPNLVLVSLDTLRADRLSLYGYARETSPNVDRWARRRAAVFLDAVAPSPWTMPSHVSLFTGLDALRHGTNQVAPVPRFLTMMAERLRKAGYATAAVTGGAYLTSDYGFDRGFDSFAAWGGASGPDVPEVVAGVDGALRRLHSLADRPFFLFFHTYEIHEPYQPRQPYYSRFSGGSAVPPEGRSAPVTPTAGDGFQVRRRLRLGSEPLTDAELPVLSALYDAGIAFTDEQLGRLLAGLEALGLERDTAVVITSDHGEALGERGLGGHAYLYDFNLSIPLILSLPDGRGAGRRIANQVRLVDVLPTFLDLAGIAPAGDLDGASLLPLIDEPSRASPRDAWSYASSSNYGIALRTANHVKYIFDNTAWSPGCGKEEMYDLSVDPREQADVSSGSESIAPLRLRVDRLQKSWSSGISVWFSNGGATAYSGTLHAPFLHQITVKTRDRSCPGVAWNERTGRIDYSVPPGRSFGVLLESVGAGRLGVTVAGSGPRSGFETELDPRELERPWQIHRDGHRWRQSIAGAAPPATGVVVRWLGDARRLQERGRELDPATREQLRALGYVQ